MEPPRLGRALLVGLSLAPCISALQHLWGRLQLRSPRANSSSGWVPARQPRPASLLRCFCRSWDLTLSCHIESWECTRPLLDPAPVLFPSVTESRADMQSGDRRMGGGWSKPARQVRDETLCALSRGCEGLLQDSAPSLRTRFVQ